MSGAPWNYHKGDVKRKDLSLVLIERRRWSNVVRRDIRLRVETCVEWIRKGEIPYPASTHRIEIGCASKPDAVTVKLLRSLEALLGTVGFGLEVYSVDAEFGDPPWFPASTKTK